MGNTPKPLFFYSTWVSECKNIKGFCNKEDICFKSANYFILIISYLQQSISIYIIKWIVSVVINSEAFQCCVAAFKIKLFCQIRIYRPN